MKKSFQGPLADTISLRVNLPGGLLSKLSNLFCAPWYYISSASLSELVVISPKFIWTCCPLYRLQHPRRPSLTYLLHSQTTDRVTALTDGVWSPVVQPLSAGMPASALHILKKKRGGGNYVGTLVELTQIWH